jgi:hypothetical protein
MVGHWLAEAMGLSLPSDQQGGEADPTGDHRLDATGANNALEVGWTDDRLDGIQHWDSLLA